MSNNEKLDNKIVVSDGSSVQLSNKVMNQDSSDELAFQMDEGRTPTDEELRTLRHVSEKIPLACWLVAIIELAERFSYYGLSAPFQNYMQYGPNDNPPGELDLKNSGATALSYFFQFWCFVTPVLGGYVADTYWGKYKTIFICAIIYIIGIFILFITSLPAITSRTTALAGFLVAIIIIGTATGGVKANVSPLIADQVPKTRPIIKVLKSGERVVQDPNVTIQNVFMIFYLVTNIGSLSVIATTQLESHVGFWAAYLLPLCFFSVTILFLIVGRNQYIKVPVSDKVIQKCFKVLYIGIKNKFNLDAARPSKNPEKDFIWDDKFVDEVIRALYACKVFAFYPIYWTVYGQIVNNFISQAGQMELHGIPNDLLQAFDTISIIIFIPIFDKIVYPLLRRFTPMKPVSRIAIGFMFGACAMVYAAVLQSFIYKAGPCYDNPGNCAGYEGIPNRINVLIQIPSYVLISISEILASITGLEYAYTKAPVSMKSFIMSIFLLQNAFGAALGIAISPTAVNPKITWCYTGLAVACFISGVAFWFTFKHYNDKEDELNNLEYDDEDNNNLAPIMSFANSYKALA